MSCQLYEDDARIGHQEFDLKLTQRVKMSMVGVPESSFNLWASKFLAKGDCCITKPTFISADIYLLRLQSWKSGPG